jgi:hypothetical protein
VIGRGLQFDGQAAEIAALIGQDEIRLPLGIAFSPAGHSEDLGGLGLPQPSYDQELGVLDSNKLDDRLVEIRFVEYRHLVISRDRGVSFLARGWDVLIHERHDYFLFPEILIRLSLQSLDALLEIFDGPPEHDTESRIIHRFDRLDFRVFAPLHRTLAYDMLVVFVARQGSFHLLGYETDPFLACEVVSLVGLHLHGVKNGL